MLVVTVLTSPTPKFGGKKQRFSCEWNCYYCPNEPNQPRSYLHDEPSVLRANQNDFDPILQFVDRIVTLYINGHPIDKVELLVLGGTWSSYPMEYREEFVRDLFYAANTIFVRNGKRERLDLESEKKINETSKCKIIGITLETRPDCITPEEIIHFRRVGCTRVQLGIQSINDDILKLINRGCDTRAAKNAIKLLKDTGFKIDGHFMPQLPGSTKDSDMKMFKDILNDPDLELDQWKVYPCETTPWTVIKKWYDEGKYKPYSDEDLIEVLLELKRNIKPWIRLNRIVRDIPGQYILGGLVMTNLREILGKMLEQEGNGCKCIRCREVKNKTDYGETRIIERYYPASDGMEVFISEESLDQKILCGFLRLRLSKNSGAGVFPELNNTAMIRELHVYGKLNTTFDKLNSNNQHRGLGKQLIKRAKTIAISHGFHRISVIAGVGTRKYYEKSGFKLMDINNGEMMVQDLNVFNYYWVGILIFWIISMYFYLSFEIN